MALRKTPLTVSLGDYVWISPVSKGEWDVPKAGKVVLCSGSQLKVVDNDNQECWVSTSCVLGALHPTSLAPVDDMITLGELSEQSILHNLHIRYNKKIIYTYIGMMLVSVNPYEETGLYGALKVAQYRGRRPGTLAPHIYALGSHSYENMHQQHTNQCIVISGESGAGKTESTKLLLQYLTSFSGQTSIIEQQLMVANPVLEGFGNAKTVRNDNSSRFGKYLVLWYTDDGSLAGACVEPYLLERSRVTSLAAGNRNYHIFYSLAAGLDQEQRSRLGLLPPHAYACLTSGGTTECEGRNEAEQLTEIIKALKVLNFSDDEVWEIFKLLAVILNLCNVKLQSSQIGYVDSVTTPDSSEIENVYSLLQVKKRLLMGTLVKRRIQVEGEVVISELSKTQADVLRDGFSRALYYRIFIHIVNKINKAIFKHKTTNNCSIGILDIFGFEDFDNNSFEQLCINYANEQLQHFFVEHIFKLEQEEYRREGISWAPVTYDDNDKILSLISGDRVNIFSTTDDLSRLLSGTDGALVMKYNKNHEKNPFYIKAKSDISHKFGIKHYAGNVTYNVEGFLEKNRNTVSEDWLTLVRSSSNGLLRTLFSKELGRSASGRPPTVLSQYQTSLRSLMMALSQCQPVFIRCIKPNDFKQPNMFDQVFCCRQLRHSGLMNTAEIRSLGYPVRLTYAEFIHRYRIFIHRMPANCKVTDLKTEVGRICHTLLNDSGYQLGLTKVFLKQLESSRLELERDLLLEKSVLVLQKYVRAWLAKTRYHKMKEAALVIQKHWRGRSPRHCYLIIRQGYLRLQAITKSRHLRAYFVKLRERIVGMQARCRGFLVRKEKKASKPEAPNMEGNKEDIDQWITSIFDAAIEGSEHIVPPSENPVESGGKRVEFAKETDPDFLPMEPLPPEPEDSSEDFSFSRFAAANFRGNVSYYFSKQVLKQPLLDLPLPLDQLASAALWVTILRFMGDLPEPPAALASPPTPVMTMLVRTLSRDSSATGYSKAVKQLKEEGPEKESPNLINLSLANKNKLKTQSSRRKLEGSELKNSYNSWLEHTRSNILQKLHFIIGHGILRPELRDEIYSQICKQLTSNSSVGSQARGWALMKLCTGCFSPSPRLAPYLRCLLRRGPPLCCARLRRTMLNGTRIQPPSWLELNAIRSQKPLVLVVHLSDGRAKQLEADSAITAGEVCSRLAKHLSISDTFGFSLFISAFGEVTRLEAGGRHVLDAVSQCEQDAHERGVAERDAPWRLHYRKEMFAPWQGLSAPDPVATDLIYKQIVKGILTLDYRCTQDSELALIAAQQYYIEHGTSLVPLTLKRFLSEYIPPRQLKHSGAAYWEKLITDTFSKSYFVKDQVPGGIVKADIVSFAKSKWPLQFSKHYEATQVAGPEVGAANLIIAVSSVGVCIITTAERVLLQLSFIEIHSITLLPSVRGEVKEFQLVTIQGYEFVYQSPSAEIVTDLIQWIIDSLKQISKYFIAVQDYSPPGGGGLLSMKKGELIALEEGERGAEWLTGVNVLSGEWGEFPGTSVRVLPTILQPPLHIVSYFNKEGALDGTLRAKAIQRLIPLEIKHTLEQYCKKYFRPPLGAEPLYQHSPHPLRLPLHQTLQTHPQKDAAVTGFMAVLKYMGDLPAAKESDLIDPIFQGPTDHEILRDELYCQLMKQLTDNKWPQSEERGWELMCLATGLFAPSSEVLKELRLFLSSRDQSLAYDSLQRLEQTLTHGNRKWPPHWTEVQAMQQRLPITHTVCFPNFTEQRFEVNSTTRIGDLVDQIGDRLNFQSTEGFSLVVSIRDMTAALANEEFLFDAIQEICCWVMNESISKKGQASRSMYELMFMRKVWLAMVPGKDKIADLTCHFPQESPKYILGFHKCSKSDAAVLGALLFRAENGDDKLNLLDDSRKVMSKLVPPYHLKLQSTKEWKKAIAEVYKKHTGMTANDAKIHFLKLVHPWSTFGSSFFDVRLTNKDHRLPENITIAINKNGIFILERQTREPLILYPFTEITSWSGTKNTFTLKVGSVTLECATDLNYKMDDLITSYTALITPRNGA